MFLSCDLPPTPLFKDEAGGAVIPNISLFSVLQKFDGTKVTEIVDKGQLIRKRYVIQSISNEFHLRRNGV